MAPLSRISGISHKSALPPLQHCCHTNDYNKPFLTVAKRPEKIAIKNRYSMGRLCKKNSVSLLKIYQPHLFYQPLTIHKRSVPRVLRLSAAAFFNSIL